MGESEDQTTSQSTPESGGQDENERIPVMQRVLVSMDWQHGFSLQPTNINLQIHPGYDMVLTVTPNEAGEYGIVCNEFCGIGHHTMIGKLYVAEK